MTFAEKVRVGYEDGVIRYLLPAFVALSLALGQGATLPDNVVFVGKDKFYALVKKGQAENWKALPLGERTIQVARSLVGTPYKNYTLELDDYIETPSVNMNYLDCWTLFETSLAIARCLKTYENPTPQDMLHMIEIDRYCGGRCNGNFLSRLNYLEQWLQDNQGRGLVKDITPSLPGARKLYRDLVEMSEDWRDSRQLRANPSLIPKMAEIEHTLSKRGIWYVPTSKVAAAEKYLRDGDVICIVTKEAHGYTSHVGLAYRAPDGVLHFLHASKNHGEVLVDMRLSDYIKRYTTDAGIMVGRPNDI